MSNIVRVATWNMKQAVAPKKPLDDLWRWMEHEVNPDVIVLTEAKVPQSGLPQGWHGVWTPDGIGPNRRWGTVVAARWRITLQEAEFVHNVLDYPDFERPVAGTVHTVDVAVDGAPWATVVGAYAFLHGEGNGGVAIERIADEVHDVYSSGRENLIVAGDFNLWPCDVLPTFVDEMQMVDPWSHVSGVEPMSGGLGGSRIWTHKNGNSPNAARQELDYIFLAGDIADKVSAVAGGIEDFPDAWAVSDHAPVLVEFEI